MSLYAENRSRLVAKLSSTGAASTSVIVLQGGVATTRHETDHEDLFRQESNFHWAFGVREPDCYGIIEVGTGKSTLFVQRLPDVYRIWMGEIKTTADIQKMYEVDAVKYIDELAETVAATLPSSLLLLAGFNTDGKQNSKPGQ